MPLNAYQNNTKDFDAFAQALQRSLAQLPRYFAHDPYGTCELSWGDTTPNPFQMDGVRFSLIAVGNDDENPRISFLPEVPATAQNMQTNRPFYDETNTDGMLMLQDFGADAHLSDFQGNQQDIQNTLLALARESIDELNANGYDTVTTLAELRHQQLQQAPLIPAASLPPQIFDWSNFTEADYLRMQQDLQRFDPDTADDDLPELYGSILVGDTAFDLQTFVNEAQNAYDAAATLYYPHDADSDEEAYAERIDGFPYDDDFALSFPDPIQPLRDEIQNGMSYVQFQKGFTRNIQHFQPQNKQDILFLRAMHHDGKFFQSMRKAILEEEAHKQAGRNLAKTKRLKETLIASIQETVRQFRHKGYGPAEIGQGLQQAAKTVTQQLEQLEQEETKNLPLSRVRD